MQKKELSGPSKALWAILRWSVIALLLGLLARSLVIHFPQLQRHPLSVEAWWLAASVALLSLYYLLLALAWHGITLANRLAIAAPDAMLAWTYSMLGKYLPGKLGLVLGRIYLYKRAGRSASQVALALWLELALQTLAGALVVALTLTYASQKPVLAFRPAVWLLAAGLAVASAPRAIQLVLNLLARLLRKKPMSISMRIHHSAGLLMVYTLASLVLGLAFFALVQSFHPLAFDQLAYLTGAILLAGLAGLLSLFAPAGLGVREGVLVLVLQPIMPEALAVVTALAVRLWTTGVELVLVLACWVFDRIRSAKMPISARSSRLE